jgi:hypothetical protein
MALKHFRHNMNVLLEATENYIIAAMFLSLKKHNIGCIDFKNLLQFDMFDQILNITLISHHNFITNSWKLKSMSLGCPPMA